MNDCRVLLVDDDEVSLLTLQAILEGNGFSCSLAHNGMEALERLNEETVDIVVTDQQMPLMDGLDLLKEIKSRHQNLPCIILTAYATINSAVTSIKEGANDYLQKPFDMETLIATIRKSLNFSKLSEENLKLKDILNRIYSFHNIVTRSPVMRKALEDAQKVAAVPNTNVVIYGESGTGKEVLAQAIHFSGPRVAERFVAVNCASIPHSLLESELFGHVKGAFTGADRNREGKFAFTQRGTIFLDEIGDMSMDLQAKLLRVLQERVYEPVGSNVPVKVDCRVIAATNRPLNEMVRKNRFRADLFHRINSFPITLPPLRERMEDVPLLVEHIIEQLRHDLGKPLSTISEGAMKMLLEYHWPGNIRELKNTLERAAILAEDGLILPDHLIIRENICGGSSRKQGIIEQGESIRMEIEIQKDQFSLDKITSEVLKMVLEKSGNNKSKAAEMLKVDRTMFYRRS